MNATSVEKATPPVNEPIGTTGRVLPPAISLLLRWGLLALVAIGIALSIVLGLVQEWLWMRQLDYVGILWTLLFVKRGLFGVSLFISILYLWINLRLAARNIDELRGASFFSKAIRHPADASRTINIDVSPKLLVFAIDAAIVVLSLFFAFGIVSQWDTYLRFRYGGSFGVADPLFWRRPGVLRLPPSVL